MAKRRNRRWEPGDTITKAADNERRRFSPAVRDVEREEYELKLWSLRLGLGHVLTAEELHAAALQHVLIMRGCRYQRGLGEADVIEACQAAAVDHAATMREAKKQEDRRRREERRIEAIAAYNEASAELSLDAATGNTKPIKSRAAKKLGISTRQLSRRLGGK